MLAEMAAETKELKSAARGSITDVAADWLAAQYLIVVMSRAGMPAQGEAAKGKAPDGYVRRPPILTARLPSLIHYSLTSPALCSGVRASRIFRATMFSTLVPANNDFGNWR